MSTRPALFAAIALLLCGMGAWWLLSAGHPARPMAAMPVGSSVAEGFAKSIAAASASASPASAALASQASSAGGDVFLTPELLQTFETMLLEASGSSDVTNPANLKRRLAELVPEYFPASLVARATALIERYVDYRVALGEITPPADPGEPRALRDALDARQRARERHFAPEEYEALFAGQAQLDRYTLARLEIERNPDLSAAQKHAALKDIEKGLSPEQRAQREQAVAHVAVAAQTAALDARNASAQERFAQRSALYGDAAAAQLAQLDRENSDWQARLAEYANAQAKNANPEQLQQLRQQLFSEQEQLRVEAALATRQLAPPQRP